MSKYTLKIDLPELDQLLSEISTGIETRINELLHSQSVDRQTALKEARRRQDKLRQKINRDLKDIDNGK